MKNLKFIVCLIFTITLHVSVFAQIAIGKSTVDGAGILDFDAGKGIILPWVETAGAADADGTLVFDTTDNKVKVKQNGVWVDLSNTGTLDANRINAVATHLSKNENGTQFVLGSTSPTASGVLVLESTDKALILSKMASPHLNMVDPEPGTIVYDTDSKLLCVFNGSVWTFWGE
jgi:hypothetical protein